MVLPRKLVPRSDAARAFVMAGSLVLVALVWFLATHVLLETRGLGPGEPIALLADLGLIVVLALAGAVVARRWAAERERAAEARATSERQFRAVFEAPGMGSAIVAPDGRLIRVNSAVCRFLQRSEEELLATDFPSLMDPEDVPSEIELARRLFAGEIDTFERETRFVRPDGSRVWGRLTMSVVRDGGGRVVQGIEFVQDITDEKQSEMTFREDAERRRLLIEEAADPIVRLDAAGRVVDVNPAACERLGYPREALLAMTVADVLGAANLAANPLRLTELRTGATVTSERSVVHADGHEIPTEIRARLLPDGGILALVRDLSERRAAEEERVRLGRDLQAIVLMSPLPIVTLDEHGTVVSWNPAAERVFGWTAEETIGKPYPLVREARAEEFDRNLQEALAGKPMFGRYHRRVRKDGTELDVRVWNSPLRDEQGRVVRMFGILEDVTAAKAAEAELRRLAAAVEQSTDSIVMTDLDGAITFVNPAFERTTGYSGRELVGLRWREAAGVFGGDPEAGEEIGASLGAGRPWSGVLNNRRADGTTADVDVIVTPVHDERGAIAGSVAVGRDMSHVRELEGQLRQAQKMEAVGRLAGGVAHDFNNLLAAIRGYAELGLASTDSQGELREYLGEILGAADRARLLTRRLLAFARKQPASTEIVDLGAVLRGLTPMLRQVVDERSRLLLRIDPRTVLVRLDRDLVEQAIINLAINARDALDDRGTIEISVGVKDVDERDRAAESGLAPGRYALLSVVDDGQGIPAGDVPHLFEPFFTTKPMNQGTGLGLSIVYSVVTGAGGTILVDTSPGRGSRFDLLFPLIEREEGVEAPADQEADERPNGDEEILLVEDEDAVAAFLGQILTNHGYRVRRAVSAEDALAIVEDRGLPALLVTDVLLPGRNGQELVTALRQRDRGLRVLFVSGYEADRLTAAERAGHGTAFLAKPFAAGQLLRAVRALLDEGPAVPT